MIDEADTFLPDNLELRGVLNAGHTRGGTVVRTVGDEHEPRAFTVFAPTAIALIGKMPATLADRSVLIKLRRKLRTEAVEPLRLDRLDTTDLRRQCQRWAQDNLDALRAADPALPNTLHDRAKDNWRPLAAIAAVAGRNWPQLARSAIVALTSGLLDEEEVGVLLLEDLYEIFRPKTEDETEARTAPKQIDEITCKELAVRLHEREERPWRSWGRQEKPITSRQVGVLLAPFGIIAKTVRPEDGPRGKGYTFAQCEDAFKRYLPFPTVTPGQTSNDTDFHEQEQCSSRDEAASTVSVSRTPVLNHGGHGVTVLEENPVIVSTSRTPALNNGGHGVTVSTTPREEEKSIVDATNEATFPLSISTLTQACPQCGATEWLFLATARKCALCGYRDGPSVQEILEQQ